MVDDVTVLRPGPPTRDARGNAKPGPVDEIPVTGCAVLPPAGQTAPTVEITDGQQTVIIVRVLYAPLGTDLRPADRIRHAGRTYEVVGEPSPFVALLPHIEANLKAVTG
ncbi:hypothetical protein [Streptomyces chryseus]|uniref:hypothetical protein n=1 Tax=Streptomyces chryseus TaxID=68186 RepID=UPI00110F95ED|nr:hypothetical protein [Streptomyces chryseus]